MLRTLSSFLAAAALSLAALILGPVLERLPPPAPPAPDPQPAPAPTEPTLSYPARAQVPGVLTLRGALSGTHSQQGGDGSVVLLAEIEALRVVDLPHPPLELALVLDRSGSMAGPKLEAAREAARRLIRRLRPSDRVTLVAYGSTVDVLARSVPGSPSGKASLLRAVDRVEDFGGTFISGALEAAAKVIARAPGDRNRRILLLSDGVANEGITSRRGLSRLAQRLAGRGITISSVGIGVDFDEDTMLALADASGGRYAYVRGPADLAGALDREIVAAKRSVAREVLLRIRPRDGARVTKVYGYPFVQRQGETWIRLRDMESGGRAKVVLSLSTPAGAAGDFAVADLSLTYRTTEGLGDAPQALEATFTLGHRVTPDASLVAAGRDREVLEAGARSYAAQALDEATRVYAEGRTQDARRILQRRLERVMLENLTLGSETLEEDLRTYQAAGEAFGRTRAGSAAGRDLVKDLKLDAISAQRE